MRNVRSKHLNLEFHWRFVLSCRKIRGVLLLRLAHISDLHFSDPQWTLSQFFSKRWVGNFNLILSRQKEYTQNHLHSLIDTFRELQVTHILVTGDLSCTSLESEFRRAQEFITSLTTAGFQVFTVPGNHDHYTHKAYREQTFYSFFNPTFSELSLKLDKVTTHYLGNQWWIIGLDTALATPWFSAYGVFSSAIEQRLKKVLQTIPPGHQILLMNHFPLFAQPSPRTSLHRHEALRALIEQFPQIRFYLHGHTHRHCIADLRSNGLPIILDSGSIAHYQFSSWNLIEIGTEHSTVEGYRMPTTPSEKGWIAQEKHCFKW